MQVFFIRDGAQFPDLAHALKPSPVNRLSPAWRTADFLSYHPESMHMVGSLPAAFHQLPWGTTSQHCASSDVSALLQLQTCVEACLPETLRLRWSCSTAHRGLSSEEQYKAQKGRIRQSECYSRALHPALLDGSAEIEGESVVLVRLCGHAQVTYLLDDAGVPANYRQMNGSSVNTYTLINKAGAVKLVKFRWVPTAGAWPLPCASTALFQLMSGCET